MYRIRSAILGFAVALLMGSMGSDQPVPDKKAESLEGTWEITSVQRDGEADSTQVGSLLTFTRTEVAFQPKVVLIDDGTS